MNQFLKNGRCNSGFTLIELLLVITVLALLSSVFTPRLTGFIEKSKEEIDKVSANNLIEDYYRRAVFNDLSPGDYYIDVKPQKDGHERFYLEIEIDEKVKILVKYDDENGDLLAELTAHVLKGIE